MSVVWLTDESKLEQQFASDVDELLRKSRFNWYVIWGWRSYNVQAELYKKYLAGGPKAAPPGESAHNCGLAVDVVLDRSDVPGLQMLWNSKLAGWVWLRQAVLRHPRLHSLWQIGDYDHIERYRWRWYARQHNLFASASVALEGKN